MSLLVFLVTVNEGVRVRRALCASCGRLPKSASHGDAHATPSGAVGVGSHPVAFATPTSGAAHAGSRQSLVMYSPQSGARSRAQRLGPLCWGRAAHRLHGVGGDDGRRVIHRVGILHVVVMAVVIAVGVVCTAPGQERSKGGARLEEWRQVRIGAGSWGWMRRSALRSWVREVGHERWKGPLCTGEERWEGRRSHLRAASRRVGRRS